MLRSDGQGVWNQECPWWAHQLHYLKNHLFICISSLQTWNVHFFQNRVLSVVEDTSTHCFEMSTPSIHFLVLCWTYSFPWASLILITLSKIYRSFLILLYVDFCVFRFVLLVTFLRHCHQTISTNLKFIPNFWHVAPVSYTGAGGLKG